MPKIETPYQYGQTVAALNQTKKLLEKELIYQEKNQDSE